MWTKEQLEAINITGVNTTVSASAGAGKTAVLVERLMKRILKDKVSVDTIVSLTFTDAAAAEMKNRLMNALLHEYEQDPTNEYLYDQITLLPSANISTIHSFCLNLLKNHYYILNLNPESLNNIISESEDLALQQESFNYVLEHFDKDKSASVMEFISSSAMSIDRLNSMINELVTKANGTTNPTKFLDDSINIYNTYTSLNDLPEPFLDMFWTYHLHHVTQLKEFMYQALRVLDTLDSEKNTDDQKEWINTSINYIKELEEIISKKDYSNYISTFKTLAALKNTTVRGEADYKSVRDAYYDTLRAIAKILYSEEELLNQLSLNQDVLSYLIEMAKMYNEYYKEGIIKLNRITFNDMETLTYNLLQANNQEVAKELQKEITDILVDEFQDTNQLQNEIINLISNGSNVFRVGDIKQSIYRFRGAEPSIMQNLISQPDSKSHKTIYLSNNFRSKESIVEYNNHFFNHLMNLEMFDSSYLENDFVKPGTSLQKEESVPVELHRINTKNDDYPLEISNFSANDFKASYIASKIVELYNEDPRKKWNRFTVLVSSHSRKLELKKAFDNANIPYFIALPDGLYTSDGVSTILAYLKLVYNPSDKISLMAVLKNLFDYSDNQITELFLATKNLTEVSNTLNSNILKQVYYFNKVQHDIPISDILNYVLNLNNYYENKLSKQNRTNVDIFSDIVNEYDKTKVGIYGLLKQVERAKDAKAQEGSSISSEDNVVNVMTIHNSKGLQFETVFLMSKDRAYSPTLSQGYLIHPTYGLAIKSIDLERRIQYDNIANVLIRYFDNLEAIEEDMRTLYVALTRPQKELYIVDTVNFKDNVPPAIEPFSTNLVLNTTFTKWLESAHVSHPSRHLIYVVEEELELLKTEPLLKDYKEIVHLQAYDIKPAEVHNDFKATKLSFTDGPLGVDIGTLIHNTMEKLPDTKWSTELIKETTPQLTDYYVKRIENLSNNEFFNSFRDHTIHKEYPFIVEIDNVRERGIIDYLVETDDSLYIVDFKTDALDLEETFIDRYQKQLQFYKQALSLIFKDKEIKAYIYSFKLESFIEIK